MAFGNDEPAPKPLYRDPVCDGAADPVVIWNPHVGKWWMFYTNRRANVPNLSGVAWVHGTRIGIAESADGGVTWKYVGTAEIDVPVELAGAEPTYWAPEVITAPDGRHHMFVTVVPGVFENWNHPRAIVHVTSGDLRHWGDPQPMSLSSDRVIDACVFQLSDGSWRMSYNNERDRKSIYYADSPDLKTWTDRGKAVGDQAGEGPKVFAWRGAYWMVTDVWDGLAVYRSDDTLVWKRQPKNLLKEPGAGTDDRVKGGHLDVVVSGDRAFLFYFTHPGRRGPDARKDGTEQRRSSILVVELHPDGQWLTCDRDKSTYIQLQPGASTQRVGWTPVGLSGGGGMFTPAISPADPNLMMINCDMSAAYISQDGGHHWRMINHAQLRSDTRCAPAFHPSDPDIIYASSGGRLRVSHDRGRTFEPIGDLRQSLFGRIAINPSDPKVMLVGTRDRKCHISRDVGQTWTQCNGPEGDVIGLHFDRTRGGRTMFAATNDGIWRSDDGGRIWLEKTAGLPWRPIRGFAGGSDASGGDIVLYCTVDSREEDGAFKGGVYCSTDRGQSWQSAMGEGINVETTKTGQWAYGPIAQYRQVLTTDANPKTAYALNTSTGFHPPHHETVYRSDDAGRTWRATYFQDPRFDQYNLTPNYVTATIGPAVCASRVTSPNRGNTRPRASRPSP